MYLWKGDSVIILDSMQ